MVTLKPLNVDGPSVVLRGDVVRSDPAVAMPPRSAIKFQSVAVKTTGEAPLAAWSNNGTGFDGLLLTLSFSDGAAYSMEGSAVLVAPGIALCARHVIEPRLTDIESGALTVKAIGLFRGHLFMQYWHVKEVTSASGAGADICILGLELASALRTDIPFRQAMISTRIPRLGEELTLCGFKPHVDVVPNGSALVGGFIVCKGVVTARYPSGRDRVMLPCPVVEVECPAYGAMSGGPVFDSAGLLVGLVSTSFDDSTGSGPAYVSLLYPALTRPFRGGWPTGLIKIQPARLLDLDCCHIVGREHVMYQETTDAYCWTVRDWDYKVGPYESTA